MIPPYDSMPATEQTAIVVAPSVRTTIRTFVVAQIDGIVRLEDSGREWLVMGRACWDGLDKRVDDEVTITPYGALGPIEFIANPDAAPFPVDVLLRQLGLCAAALIALPVQAARDPTALRR